MPSSLGTPPPFRTIAFGKGWFVVLPNAGVCSRAEAPLDAEVAREVAGGDHDARLDLDLGSRGVELADQAPGLLDVARQVAHDDRVRALVDVDLAASRERAFALFSTVDRSPALA